ncbi:murein hydrolase activator EnvC family protein [Pontivivens insulae]|uniref:Murein hydrolase activator EnvC n=1 Tax=Pontivivens insulae TaxID=1639689 RepID=A0A2R8AFQ9_9RHOB|nr:peptidoglycan DD-metalloendopeptidase family protein [Pontivivens insulae]RED12259.1 septal ring factor EnvC (AmiA/AmiB activator) [Pontivivens insulae]SPF31016.1 Murein hydrolase activator EnvC [Pontivivens insulae]
MRLRWAIFAAGWLLTGFLPVAEVRAQGALAQAERASDLLDAATAQLVSTRTDETRLAALGRIVQAFELGLNAQREAERSLALRMDVVEEALNEDRRRLARVIGGLQRVGAAPTPLLLLHPDGPEGAVRAGQMMSRVIPELHAEAEALRAMMLELRLLETEQARAEERMREGLAGVATARAALQGALNGRASADGAVDDELIARLRADSATLQAFSRALARQSAGLSDAEGRRFEEARGTLDLPVPGQLIHPYGSRDEGGAVRPGMVLEVEGINQVLAPWPATLRYTGEFLDYGQIVVLEPQAGWLMVLAGLSEVQRQSGEIVLAGEPLGLLTGSRRDDTGFLVEPSGESGPSLTRTLYVELRRAGTPVDPAPWFRFE